MYRWIELRRPYLGQQLCIFLEERSSPFIHFVPLFSRIYITTLHYENIEKFQRSQIQ